MGALADRSAPVCLGSVRPHAARHLVEKLIAFDPSERLGLDEVAKHAWLTGGLDTRELDGSFSGLQSAQELTQRALGSLSAWIRTSHQRDAKKR